MRPLIPIVIAASVGCGGAPAEHPSAPKPVTSASAAAVGPAAFVCTEPAAGKSTPERDAAIADLVGGRPWRAAEAFARALEAHPADLTAYTLHVAALAEVESSHRLDLPSLTRSARRVTDAPHGHEVKHAVEVEPTPAIELTLVSSGALPVFDDPSAWTERNGFGFVGALSHPELRLDLRRGGNQESLELDYPDHRIAFVGESVMALVPWEGAEPWLLDFSAIVDDASGPRAPDQTRLALLHARAVGKNVIVSLGDTTGTLGPNGVLGALDAKTGRVLWWSEPHVANARSFVIAGSHAITGFGLKGKPGTLSVIDLADGKVVSHTPLRDAPVYVLARGDRVFVRGEASESVFAAKNLAPAPAADLATAPPPVKLDVAAEKLRCALARASALLDARNGSGAIVELDALAPNDPRVAAMRAAAEFVGRAGDTEHPIIDLTVGKVLVPKGFPFRQGNSSPKPSTPQKPWQLVQTRVVDLEAMRKASQKRGELLDEEGPSSAPPTFFAPPATFEMPQSFGAMQLARSLGQGNDAVGIYGDHFVALMRSKRPVGIYDVGELTRGPGEGGKPGSESSQIVFHAAANAKTLFVASGRPGARTDLGGRKDYLSAIDLETGAVEWQSDPLSCNVPFAVSGDAVVTAIAYPKSPSELLVFRADTGQIAIRTKLKGTPLTVTTEGPDIVVATANELTHFTLRN